MNPLYAARTLRAKLAVRLGMQFTAATALAIAALSSGANAHIGSMIVCVAVSCIFVYFGLRTYRQYEKHHDFARAQTVLRRQVKLLTAAGWVLARQRKLPPSCRGSIVVYTEDGDLAFVIGLSGFWPLREALAAPQDVANVLSKYGTPHIPVCLAAFVDTVDESFNYGVLAVGPTRFCPALEEAVESFREAQERTFSTLVSRMVETPPEDAQQQDGGFVELRGAVQ